MDAEQVAAEVMVQCSKLELKGNGTEILVIKSDVIEVETVARIREHLKKQLGADAKIAILVIDTDSDITLLKLNE